MTTMSTATTPTAAALRNAAHDLQRAESAMNALIEAIERHEKAAPPQPADLEALRGEVADLAAAVALGEATEAELIEARSRLAAAVQAERSQRSEQEQHAEVLSGLQRRRQRAEAARDDARATLAAAERAHLDAEFERADAEYVAAALALGRAYRRAAALRGGHHSLFSSRRPEAYPLGGAASSAQFRGSDPTQNLIDEDDTTEFSAVVRELVALKTPPAEPAKPGILARARRVIGGAA